MDKLSRNIFFVLTIAVLLILFLVILAFLSPELFFVIINLFWFTLLVLVVVFLLLGLLVILGMKKEARQLIEAFMEGSFAVIDGARFIKLVVVEFLNMIKQFISFLSPIVGSALAIWLYFLILLLYKWVGSQYDVTAMTVILTAFLIAFNALLNKSRQNSHQTNSWQKQVLAKFHSYFRDTFEIMIFIFFLTMDATFFFFLPPSLNVPLRAEVGSYDLMKRGFTIDSHLRITLNLIMIAVVIEVIRNVIRLILTSIKIFKAETRPMSSSALIKYSIRKSISQNNDHLLKFVTYTTVFSLIFLLFPRLKLLAMSVTSLTNFAMDLLMPSRLKEQNKHDDIVSRLLAKVFRI